MTKFANLLSLLKIGENVVFACANMSANDFHRILSMALLHGLQKFQMFLVGCDATGGIIETIGSSLQNDALKYLRKCPRERLVAGEAGNLEMNVLIVNQPLAGKALLDVPPIQIYLRRQLGECRSRQIFYSFFHGKGFQRFA